MRKPAGEFGFDFGERDFAGGQEHQQVVDEVGGFADRVCWRPAFAGFGGGFDDLRGFFGDLGADLCDAAGQQLGRVRRDRRRRLARRREWSASS